MHPIISSRQILSFFLSVRGVRVKEDSRTKDVKRFLYFTILTISNVLIIVTTYNLCSNYSFLFCFSRCLLRYKLFLALSFLMNFCVHIVTFLVHYTLIRFLQMRSLIHVTNCRCFRLDSLIYNSHSFPYSCTLTC